MACCAFIAFLVSQVYLFAIAPLRRLTGTPRPESASAVAWRLGSAVASTPDGHPPEKERAPSFAARHLVVATPRQGRAWLPLAAAGVIELTVLVGAGQSFLTGTGRQMLTEEFEWLAGIETLSDLKDLCSPGRSRIKDSP
jgi:hypothetical protein